MTFPRKRESNRRRFQWPNQKKKKLLITLFKVLVLKSEECIKQTLLQSLFLIKPITCTLPANQVWFSIFHLLILLFWFLSKCMSVCNIKFHNLNLFTSLKKNFHF